MFNTKSFYPTEHSILESNMWNMVHSKELALLFGSSLKPVLQILMYTCNTLCKTLSKTPTKMLCDMLTKMLCDMPRFMVKLKYNTNP